MRNRARRPLCSAKCFSVNQIATEKQITEATKSRQDRQGEANEVEKATEFS